uniref:Homeobox domain-containing protein n=1 Tax=Tetranychus urticae TaxID=32264 RepID=T1KXH2_TETUR
MALLALPVHPIIWFENARAKWRKSEASKSQSDCDYELRGSLSHLLKETFERQTNVTRNVTLT